ncbi:MAG: glycosyltransferase [Candidatus Cloacimonadaceae bacterium]|nr:glycosyltransferase [Candidatus Cloacimonadaceae bacterium]
MKICIISNSHSTTDVRLYYKMALSLAKIAEVHLITKSGVRNSAHNPFQAVVDTESNWYALYLIYLAAKQLKPDLVICVEPLTMLAGIRLKRKTGCKVIFDVHEFFADAYAERFPPVIGWIMKQFYLSFERRLQSHADAVTAVNQEILDQLLPRHGRSRGTYLPNYPVKHVWDYSCETPAEISLICNMRFDLIYIGGLTRDRGVFKILESAAILKSSFPNLSVLILGKFFEASVEREFNAMINDNNLNAIVYYQPWLPAEKIGLLLKRSRIGLWIFNPQNRRISKAVPLKVLEYFAAGLPVVTIDTPLMKDLVEKKELGVCCHYRARSIADAVSGLLKLNKTQYREMSKRIMGITETEYNWEAVEPLLFKVVNKLAGTP